MGSSLLDEWWGEWLLLAVEKKGGVLQLVVEGLGGHLVKADLHGGRDALDEGGAIVIEVAHLFLISLSLIIVIYSCPNFILFTIIIN